MNYLGEADDAGAVTGAVLVGTCGGMADGAIADEVGATIAGATPGSVLKLSGGNAPGPVLRP
jgi:hypothetical protein